MEILKSKLTNEAETILFINDNKKYGVFVDTMDESEKYEEFFDTYKEAEKDYIKCLKYFHNKD